MYEIYIDYIALTILHMWLCSYYMIKMYFLKPSLKDGIWIKIFGACENIENGIGFSYDALIWFWKIKKRMHMVLISERCICFT